MRVGGLEGAHGAGDLVDVLEAAVAAGEVPLERVLALWCERAIHVIGHELDQVIAGELVRRRRDIVRGQRRRDGLGASAPRGGDQQHPDDDGGRGQDPRRPLHAVLAGDPAEHQREGQEEHPGEGADARRHARAKARRDAVVQQATGVDGDDGQQQGEDRLGGEDDGERPRLRQRKRGGRRGDREREDDDAAVELQLARQVAAQ